MSAMAKKRAKVDVITDDAVRLCAVSRAQRPVAELIRFVVSPEGTLVPDLARRLPGRGVWVSASRDLIAKAVKTRAFARSLKCQVTLPDDDLPGLIERLIVKRACEKLALANKAGLVVTGFAKIEATLAKGDIVALMHASDAAVDGTAKLSRKFTAIQRACGKSARIIDVLTNNELSLAMGRSNVVHAALARGGAATKIIDVAGRLARYRSDQTEHIATAIEAKTPEATKPNAPKATPNALNRVEHG